MTFNCNVNDRKERYGVQHITILIKLNFKLLILTVIKQTLCSRGIGLPLDGGIGGRSKPIVPPGLLTVLLMASLVNSLTQAWGSLKPSMKSGMRGHDTRHTWVDPGSDGPLGPTPLDPERTSVPPFFFLRCDLEGKILKGTTSCGIRGRTLLGGAGDNNRGKRHCYILLTFFHACYEDYIY